ncbi:MAG: FadR family transcriptional regulator [Chloroflexi bacterium]|nr:FadR family transcriptional regulator [Chloroflexota bacterium]
MALELPDQTVRPETAIGPVARSTLVDRTVERLLEAIHGGILVPGSKLPNEQELTAQLGVSRTATREALQRLVSLEVIDARHGHGYFVRTPEAARAIRPEVLALSTRPEELAELLEARTVLEKELAALAARRAGEAHLAAMRAALDGMVGAFAAGAPTTEYDVAFHLAVAEAAGNRFLLGLADAISTYLRTMRARLGTWPNTPQDTVTMHQDIYQAIASSDAESAAAAMARHLRRTRVQFQHLRECL